MAPQGPAYNVDWVWSSASNVHVANDRDWFTTYVPFKTHLTTFATGDRISVLGIGDVELEVRRSDSTKRNGKKAKTIVLHDVLYAPDAVTNILGAPITQDYDWSTGPDGGKLMDKHTGVTVGLLDNPKLGKLWLKGQRKGQTSLDPDQERQRWKWRAHASITSFTVEAATTSTHHSSSRDKASAPSKRAPSPAYTTEEKRWLKVHYGGEYHFLMAYGLKISNEDDREQGRSMVRGLMSEEGSDGELCSSEEEDEANDFLADLENDPTSHLADCFFAEAELDWIEKYYRHSGNFLLMYGLKPYNNDDCEEGRAIARAFMAEDARVGAPAVH